MKHLLLIFSLTFSTLFGNSQVQKLPSKIKSPKKIDTSITSNRITPTSDTITKKINDSIVMSPIANGNLKVIVAKETSEPDYFKYIFPILTLLLGIVLNKFLDYLKDKKNTKKVGQRWIAEIRCLEIPIQSQIDVLTKYLPEIQKEQFDIPELEIFPMLNCEIFKTLDKAELIKSIELFKGKKYEDAILSSNRIHGFIDVLASHHIALQKKFEEYLQSTSGHTTSLSRNLQSLLRAFGNYGVALEIELQQDPTNDPRYQPILQLFDKYITPFTNSGEYDVFVLRIDFFMPFVQILGHLTHDNRIDDMANAASACLNDIKGIEMERRYWATNISTLLSRYENDLKELPMIVQEAK